MALELAASTHSIEVERMTWSRRSRSVRDATKPCRKLMLLLAFGRRRMSRAGCRDGEGMVGEGIVGTIELW